ncbi:MAG: 50S ribosomal protein L19e [Candidatus Diapherotrites archaeon]|nr:50S ribosomal protein L19e [Candidatus Diapherotrites archaeon]
MNLTQIKRIAAQILKVGETKIWINPEKTKEAKEAMTKEDVRGLIKEKIVLKRKENLQSRGAARILKEKKKKGRKKGKGKKTGTKKARAKKKESWMKNVRAQRKTLKKMKEEGIKTEIPYREIYNRIKGGYFKGKKYISALEKGGKKK